MKRILFTILFFMVVGITNAQVTYYWVGGTASATFINTGSNWNTSLNGTGSARPSSTGATDILIFDGTNLGGSVPATGPATILANGSITCAQIKIVNNADIIWVRSTSGTSTITISGELGDDFVIEAGSKLSFTSTIGSLRVAMGATNTGRCSGALVMITPLQARFDNTITGTPGTFVFTNGASLRTNITAASSSYAFGSSSQSSENWVVFEDGAHLYYEGGYSPMGGTSAFSAINLKPGSVWHHRANNGLGSFFNRKSFGNIIVENNATLTADGPIYRINNLTVNTGCTFTTHISGETTVMGNVLVDGTLSSAPATTNVLVLAGNTQQTVSGTGTISVAGLTIGDKADVLLNKSISLETAVKVYGKLNFNTNQLSGAATFTAGGVLTPVAGTGNTITGSYLIKGNTAIASSSIGQSISGSGIPSNTMIVSFSVTNDTIYVSNPSIATAAGTSLSVTAGGATLVTSNTNGFDPASGSVITAGNKTYENKINYIVNAATVTPFGITTGATENMLQTGFVEINAPVTVNSGITVSDHLLLNGKMILRPLDTVHIVSGATITGTFNSSNYIATGYNNVTGEQSILQYDGLAASTVLPIGTATYYLPYSINPVSASNFSAAVFENITANGTVTGTAFTPSEKQNVVNAVWNINRLSGSGAADIQIGWDAALEGSTFSTLPDTDIGIITNDGTSWSLPVGVANNTTNNATATIGSFGAFSVGAVPQVSPFVFNPIPDKAYGTPDFNAGATSLNTTQPIVYSSSNSAVATIVNGNIHITGTGTAVITATQATDGFYPAASNTQTLNVTKTNLTIKADDKTRFEGLPNPTLTITYTGLVYGETAAAFLTPVQITTTAVTASAPGTYPITVSGATSNNYNITFVNGVLTVQAKQNQVITFNAPATKTYGNADFATGAVSTNNSIPVTYTSSNTGVATITGNTIHITGAGTTTITASQAGSDGYFAATDVVRTLTVNKAALTIKVSDTVKVTGEPNPAFIITYTGFVLGETAANLSTQPTVLTDAVTNSAPGYYTLTPAGSVSQNYSFTIVAGKLTILPLSGTGAQYMNAFLNANGNLIVRVYAPEPALADILLYDIKGRVVAKKNLFMPKGFINTELYIPSVLPGIYIVIVRGEGVNLWKKIQIIK